MMSMRAEGTLNCLRYDRVWAQEGQNKKKRDMKKRVI